MQGSFLKLLIITLALFSSTACNLNQSDKAKLRVNINSIVLLAKWLYNKSVAVSITHDALMLAYIEHTIVPLELDVRNGIRFNSECVSNSYLSVEYCTANLS